MIKPVGSGLMVVVLCFGVAVGRAGEPAGADARAVEIEAVEKAVADLYAQMEAGLRELVQTRRDADAFARTFESENEPARALVAEMIELRRALREKDAELRRLMLEDPEYAELAQKEKALAEQSQEIQEKHAEQTKLLNTLREEAAKAKDPTADSQSPEH